jgi:Domain of unknown function (DUF3303)
MLFHVTWEFTDETEESQHRSLELFSKWQPPAGSEFKEFYGFVDGSGGVAIVEVDSFATLGRAIAPFTSWMRFTTIPIVPIEESAGIAAEALAWRDSVS